MLTRVSQKEVALAAGVHPTTVSLALRDSPRLPAATRTRIQALALKLGYQPDPLLDALNAYRLAGRERRFQGVIAWLNCWEKTNLDIFKTGILAPSFQQALTRCETNGFRLEEFFLGPGGYTWQRLSTILHERGIQGVIIPPLPGGRAHLRLRWEWFSCLAVGYSLARPELHRATHDHYCNMRLLLRGIRHTGRRRIGLVMLRHENLRTDTQRFAAYQTLASTTPSPSDSEFVPPLWVDTIEDAEVLSWYKKHRPEAILGQSAKRITSILEAAGIEVPREVLVATGSAQENPGFPGIVEDNPHLMNVAVDYLVTMIRRGETGLPPKPVRIQVTGTWTDGQPTTPVSKKN